MLVYEFGNGSINLTSFIWISHEHPDHFSILFFRKYAEIIKENKIKILFQKTKDRRVITYLNNNNFSVMELEIDKWIPLKDDLRILCLKQGDYDSALLVESENEKILNLNDCVVRDYATAKKFLRKTGKVDLLLTQFSYAAWKGGKSNKSWRESAALEKLETIKIQAAVFQPKFIIPFASFIFFSNKENYYLNDLKNTTSTILNFFSDTKFDILIMKPGDILGGIYESLNSKLANKFWMDIDAKLDSRTLNQFDKVELNNLEEYFFIYRKRIVKNNNLFLMRLIRRISPIKLFQPVIIFISDLNKTIKFDYIKNYFILTKEKPMIKMKSESLAFIFKNSFGFDTLTVNGCFEEVSDGGFALSVKTMAIENYNNIGVYFSIRMLFDFRLIIRSFITLYRVSKKLI